MLNEAQRLIGGQRDGVVGVQVVLAIDVFQLCAIEGGAEVVGDRVAAASEVGALGCLAGVGGVELTARFDGGRLLALGEVACLEVEPFEFAALQLEAGRGLREQAAAASGEDRGGRLHLAPLQHGLGDAHLHGAAGAAVVIARLAVVHHRQVAGAGLVGGAVELQAQVAEGIDAEAHGALSEAGFVGGEEALGPIDAITPTFLAVTVEIVVAEQQVQAAVFDEPLRFGLIADECVGHGELSATCGNRQCNGAPLHHFHCDCSFGFEIISAITVPQ